MKTRNLVIATTFGFLAMASVAPAHHYYGHGHHGYGYHRSYGYVPYHHGCYYGHSNWHYVVPHHNHYRGSYYRVGRTYYYTASPVVGVALNAGDSKSSGIEKLAGVIEPQMPTELTFGGLARYDDLAGRLASEANALCLDLTYNYKGNKKFAEVYADAYAVLQVAKDLQDKANKGNRQLLNQRTAEAVTKFDRVLSEMGDWTRNETKVIGAESLSEKVAGVEAVLSHLSFDVGVKMTERTEDFSALTATKAELLAGNGRTESKGVSTDKLAAELSKTPASAAGKPKESVSEIATPPATKSKR